MNGHVLGSPVAKDPVLDALDRTIRMFRAKGEAAKGIAAEVLLVNGLSDGMRNAIAQYFECSANECEMSAMIQEAQRVQYQNALAQQQQQQPARGIKLF